MKLFMWIRYLIPSLLIPLDEYLAADLQRWKQVYHLDGSDYDAMAELLWRKQEFRNLVIYRGSRYPIRRRVFRAFYRPMGSLFVEAKQIGGGLFIQHGFATMITAESIGKNCWINQQVTIGFNGQGPAPVIGDNVMITCGAKVLGSITVGDGAVIGANAVVIRDVEPGAVMGGVPARKIR